MTGVIDVHEGSERERERRARRLRRARRALVAAAAAALFATWTALAVLAVRRDLGAVESLLAAPAADLDPDALARGRDRLERAAHRLDSAPLSLVRLLPVARQNLGAVEAAVTRTVPVLDASIRLRDALDGLASDGLVDDGRVRLGAVARLAAPASDVAVALERLEEGLRERLTGWLLPALWEELETRLRAVEALRRDAAAAAAAAGVVVDLLGAREPRRYLIMFINPAEARAAGGVVSGLGSISFDDGRLRLGRFSHAPDIGVRPYRPVPAPADLSRRFRAYGADTTLLVNVTMSPDVPEAALTAARAFRSLTGTATDGAIVVDARGVAALMPEGTTVEIPGTDTELGRDELAEYVYSRAYEELGRPSRRHDALIDAGEAAFGAALRDGDGSFGWLRDVATAARGGHLRFVSFHPSERAALARAGIDGGLPPAAGDAVFVTTQNLGGDKLDFWARRTLHHSCSISPRLATCTSRVTLLNRAPRDLPNYVTQRKRDALLETFLEVYVPDEATITSILLDGAPIGSARDGEDGYRATGVHLEVPRGGGVTLEIAYTLPLEGTTYSLRLWPQQPLARPESVRVDLTAPAGWRLEGPEGTSRDHLEFEGELDRPLQFEAGALRPGGIPAAWDALVRFWREPVFAARR